MKHEHFQKLDSGPMTDSAQIWKEFGAKMGTVCGHNDRNKSCMNYWEDSGPVEWPKEVTFKVPTKVWTQMGRISA